MARKINEKNLMILIMLIVITIVVIIFGISMIFGGAKGIVKDYAKGMKNFDSKLIVNLYMDEMIKESYDSKEDMMDEYDSMFSDMKDSYYEIIKYTIKSDYKLYEGNELDYQIDQLEEYYKISPKDVKEIRRYTINFECNYDGELKDVESKVIIAKIKSKWYLIGTE